MHIYWHTHTYMYVCTHGDFPGGISGKKKKKKKKIKNNPTCQCRRHKRLRFDPQSPTTIPWRRAWQPTPVFLPAEYHRHNSQGHPESDVTEAIQHVCTHAIYTMHAYIFMCVCALMYIHYMSMQYICYVHVCYIHGSILIVSMVYSLSLFILTSPGCILSLHIPSRSCHLQRRII